MISYILSMRHFYLVAHDLLLLFLNDIVLVELQPLLISYVKNDRVLKMEGTDIEGPVSIVHYSIVSLKLFYLLVDFVVVEKLYGLYKIAIIVSILFISFDHWYVTLLGLNNI